MLRDPHTPDSLLTNFLDTKDGALALLEGRSDGLRKGRSNGLRLVAPALRGDEDIVLRFVRVSGIELQYASIWLKKNKCLVMIAVKQDGLALEYAHPLLRRDTDIVRAAVKQDGLALEYADPMYCDGTQT